MGDSHSQRAGGHAQGPDMLGESNGACEKEEGGIGLQASEISGATWNTGKHPEGGQSSEVWGFCA